MKNQNIVLQKHWNIDHACYRVETIRKYIEYKEQMADFADLLIESPVNGRPISTFKLKTPLKFSDQTVNIIELPAPKVKSAYKEGFEHLEIVVDISLQDLKNLWPLNKLKLSGMNKVFNPELAIKVCDNIALKFHNIALESVVTLEANKAIFNNLTNSQVLDILKPYNPLVVGTYPLDLHTSTSDIDIIIQVNDLSTAKDLITHKLSNNKNFEIKVNQNDDQTYLFCRFTQQGVPFEIYGTKTPSVQQRAFKHFHLQERILKIAHPSFRKYICQLKQKGLKTEPAFAKAMNLSGDPYLALLDLYSSSEEQLKNKLKAHSY